MKTILILTLSFLVSCGDNANNLDTNENIGTLGAETSAEYLRLKKRIRKGKKLKSKDYVKYSHLHRRKKIRIKFRKIRRFRNATIIPTNIFEDELFDLITLDKNGKEIEGSIWYRSEDDRVSISQIVDGNRATISVSEPGDYKLEAYLVPKGVFKNAEKTGKFIEFINYQRPEDKANSKKKSLGLLKRLIQNIYKRNFIITSTITVEQKEDPLPCSLLAGNSESQFLIPDTESYLCAVTTGLFDDNSLSFVLLNDIDLRGQNFKGFFTGANFDGGGNTIKWDFSYPETLGDLTPEEIVEFVFKFDIALFGFTANNIIENFTLEVGDIIAPGSLNVGAVVGNSSGSTFRNITVNHTGKIISSEQRAGFSGFNGSGLNTFRNITVNNVRIESCTDSNFDEDEDTGVSAGFGTFFFTADLENINLNNVSIECSGGYIGGFANGGQARYKNININGLNLIAGTEPNQGNNQVLGFIADNNGGTIEDVSISNANISTIRSEVSGFMLLPANMKNVSLNNITLVNESQGQFGSTAGLYLNDFNTSEERIIENVSLENITISHSGDGRVGGAISTLEVQPGSPLTRIIGVNLNDISITMNGDNFNPIGCLWGGHFGGSNHIIEDIDISNCTLSNNNGRAGLLGGELHVDGTMAIRRVNAQGIILPSASPDLEGSGILAHYTYLNGPGLSMTDLAVYTEGLPDNFFSAGIIKFDDPIGLSIDNVYHNGLILNNCLYADTFGNYDLVIPNSYQTGCDNIDGLLNQGISVDGADILDETSYNFNFNNVWEIGSEGPILQ